VSRNKKSGVEVPQGLKPFVFKLFFAGAAIDYAQAKEAPTRNDHF